MNKMAMMVLWMLSLLCSVVLGYSSGAGTCIASVATVRQMSDSTEGGNGNFFIEVNETSYENKTGRRFSFGFFRVKSD